MPREPSERIADILVSIEKCRKYVQGMEFADFIADDKTRGAVTYELIVMGEAVRALPGELRESHPEFPWDKMQAVRNIAVHEYFRVDAGVLWQIVSQNLPPLVEPLQRLLEQIEKGQA